MFNFWSSWIKKWMKQLFVFIFFTIIVHPPKSMSNKTILPMTNCSHARIYYFWWQLYFSTLPLLLKQTLPTTPLHIVANIVDDIHCLLKLFIFQSYIIQNLFCFFMFSFCWIEHQILPLRMLSLSGWKPILKIESKDHPVVFFGV